MARKHRLPTITSVLLSVLLALGACAESAQEEAIPRECPALDAADLTEISRQRAELLLGYTEADAERCASELGWTYRVGQRDGESFALTEDYSLQRVTVVIVDDRVTEITVG
jgi:hypothetical protein